MTIHTVVLCAGRRQGVALGQDELGRPVQIFLMGPRAVDVAMERLENLAASLKTIAKSRRLDKARIRALSGGRSWELR